MKVFNNVFLYFALILCGVSLSSCFQDHSIMSDESGSVETRSCSTYFEAALGQCGDINVNKYNLRSDVALDYVKMHGQILIVDDGQYEIEKFGDHDMILSVNELGNSGKINVSLEGALPACTNATIKLTWHSTNPTGKITGVWKAVDANENDVFPQIAPIFCN